MSFRHSLLPRALSSLSFSHFFRKSICSFKQPGGTSTEFTEVLDLNEYLRSIFPNHLLTLWR